MAAKKANKRTIGKVNLKKEVMRAKPVTISGKIGQGVILADLMATKVPNPMNKDLLTDNVMTQAQAVIYGDREKTYGRPDINLESIAQLWTVYLQRRAVVTGVSDRVTINDVCQMMVLLKAARLINDPTHHDSMVDQIGYVGLQERVQHL